MSQVEEFYVSRGLVLVELIFEIKVGIAIPRVYVDLLLLSHRKLIKFFYSQKGFLRPNVEYQHKRD